MHLFISTGFNNPDNLIIARYYGLIRAVINVRSVFCKCNTTCPLPH